jgi:hypothetical protein
MRIAPHGEEALLRRLEPGGNYNSILRDAAKTPLTRIKTCWMLQTCIGHAAKGFDCSCVQSNVISVQVKNCSGA